MKQFFFHLMFSLLAMFAVAFSHPPAWNLTNSVQRMPQTRCPDICRFSLCRRVSTFSELAAPNTVVGPNICRPGQDIDFILETGEARIVQGVAQIPISKWDPPGLRAKFPKNFFYTLPRTDSVYFLSSVAFRTPVENQHEYLREICMIMPIEKYERRINGRIIDTVANSKNDCLALVVGIPSVVIEVQWFSGDDMDLSVIEPGDTEVSNKKRESKCGKFLNDNGIDLCGVFDTARERIIYRLPCSGFNSGTYTAQVKHTRNCGRGPTRFAVRVVVNGRLRKSIKGYSDQEKGAVAGTLSFELP